MSGLRTNGLERGQIPNRSGGKGSRSVHTHKANRTAPLTSAQSPMARRVFSSEIWEPTRGIACHFPLTYSDPYYAWRERGSN